MPGLILCSTAAYAPYPLTLLTYQVLIVLLCINYIHNSNYVYY